MTNMYKDVVLSVRPIIKIDSVLGEIYVYI